MVERKYPHALAHRPEWQPEVLNKFSFQQNGKSQNFILGNILIGSNHRLLPWPI